MSRHADLPARADGRAAEMRADFDLAFSRLPEPAEVDLTEVIAVRIGDEPGLLRLDGIAEVISRPLLTPVPTVAPALLGITAGRGVPVAGYDLGLLLGRPPVVPRWMVLAAGEPGVGLVFEHFDGYRRITSGTGRTPHLIEMSTLIDLITRLSPQRVAPQEIAS